MPLHAERSAAKASCLADLPNFLQCESQLLALLRLVDEFEPDLAGEHVPDGLEIAGIEAVNIGLEQRALGQDGQGTIIAPAPTHAAVRGRD
jgi:hypothetical protein